jgi:hypothetical protein
LGPSSSRPPRCAQPPPLGIAPAALIPLPTPSCPLPRPFVIEKDPLPSPSVFPRTACRPP